MTVHAETPVIKAFVQTKFLYNMDNEIKGTTACEIIGVASYPGHALTFDILIPETGAVFDYVPIHLLSITPVATSFGLRTLLVRDCPDPAIAVSTSDYLRHLKVAVELRIDGKVENKLWSAGKFLFSVDWYNKNELFNVIALEGGQICAQPNYRVLFGDVDLKLPAYKKLRAEWKVNP